MKKQWVSFLGLTVLLRRLLGVTAFVTALGFCIVTLGDLVFYQVIPYWLGGFGAVAVFLVGMVLFRRMDATYQELRQLRGG